MDLTPTQQLAGMILGEPVHDWILKRRSEGKSWRIVARDLYEVTNHRIDVTYETVRLWADDTEKAAAS